MGGFEKNTSGVILSLGRKIMKKEDTKRIVNLGREGDIK